MTDHKRTDQKNRKKYPMFLTVEQMACRSGIGENTLRNMMESRQLEYIQIGKKKLIAEEAVWEWYQRNKVTAEETSLNNPFCVKVVRSERKCTQ